MVQAPFEHQLFKLQDTSEGQVHKLYFHQFIHKRTKKVLSDLLRTQQTRSKKILKFKLGASCSWDVLPFFLQIFWLQLHVCLTYLESAWFPNWKKMRNYDQQFVFSCGNFFLQWVTQHLHCCWDNHQTDVEYAICNCLNCETILFNICFEKLNSDCSKWAILWTLSIVQFCKDVLA